MKNNPAQRAAVAAALLVSPLVPAAFSHPQVPTVEVRLIADASLGPTAYFGLEGDPSGSWVVSGRVPGSSSFALAILGKLSGTGTTPPGLLRAADTIQGFRQLSLSSPCVRGTEVAYVANVMGVSDTIWLEDRLLAKRGDPIGSTGRTWDNFAGIGFGGSLDMVAFGSATPATAGGPEDQFLVRLPAGEVLVAGGDVIPGIPDPITQILSFDVSENGAHWVASVRFGQAGSITGAAVLLDGELYNLPGGNPAITGGNSGLLVDNNFMTENWAGFRGTRVTDDGTVVLDGFTASNEAIVRGNRVVTLDSRFDDGDSLVDVDENGVALSVGTEVLDLSLLFDGLALGRPFFTQQVDVNGNGSADPGWSLLGTLPQGAFIDNGRVLTIARVLRPGGTASDIQSTIVETRLAQPSNVICDGVPNSTGRAAQLRLVGTDVAAFNDLTLRIVSLPGGATLPILSKTAGMTPLAAGGVGTLCLGGNIGRGVPFANFGENDMTVQLYPFAFPQVGGFVSAQAGETWFIQVWHRDNIAGQTTNNFSDAVSITFR